MRYALPHPCSTSGGLTVDPFASMWEAVMAWKVTTVYVLIGHPQVNYQHR